MSFKILKEERFDSINLKGGRLDFYGSVTLDNNVLIPSSGTFTPDSAGAALPVTLTRIGENVTMSWGRVNGTLSAGASFRFTSDIPANFLPEYATLFVIDGTSINSPIYVLQDGASAFQKISVYTDTVGIGLEGDGTFAAGAVTVYPGSMSWTAKKN